MASVSSLDKDLRKLRFDKYTPQAANEVRSWIETMLGERLRSGDLLDSLKDGVTLCKLVNMAIGPPGVRFKQSGMPFVQMENISLFIRACKAPPLNLQEHDVFLTIDLYESKDPTQVLQCLGAFSRAANAVNPSVFPTPIGPKSNRGGVMSPQSTGALETPLRGRGLSNASNASSSTIGIGSRTTLNSSRTGDSGRWSATLSPTKNGATSPTVVSSWSRREHEGATSPAWNIAQYGYMGGASQGNLGISFGGRRQITSAGPSVPSLAEKEKKRREEEERLRLEKEETRRRKADIEAEEERTRLEEERRWEHETLRLKQQEMRKQEAEKRKWEEEEEQWKLTEQKRRRDEEAAEARMEEDRRRARSRSREPKLKGQYLSQYQAEQGVSSSGSKYSSRVRQLEEELELAREREAEYQARRQKPREPSPSKPRARSRSRPIVPIRMDSWSRDEREILRTPRHTSPEDGEFQFPDVREALPMKSPRPLPDPTFTVPPPRLEAQRTGGGRSHPEPVAPQPRLEAQRTGGGRPLPDPATANPTKVKTHHTGSRPLPQAPTPQPLPRRIPSPQSPPRQIPSPQLPPRHIPSPQPPPRQLPTHQLPPRQEILAPHPQPSPRQEIIAPRPQPPPRQEMLAPRPQPPPRQEILAPRPQPPPRQEILAPRPQPAPPAHRASRFLGSSNPTSSKPTPAPTHAEELGLRAEQDAEAGRLQENIQVKTKPKPKPVGKASKSLLEREMEMERQRQQEWEDAQKETASRPRPTDGATTTTTATAVGVDGIGGGIGGRWDVNQWSGYTGGDGQNRGAQGIGAGRRQIVGPRPLPGQR